MRRSSSPAIPSASATSSTARATAAARLAAVLERQRQLGAHAAHHDLGLGVLEDGPADGGQLARPVVAHVEARDRQLAHDLAAVEVRHQPAERAQQRRLARSRLAGQQREAARRQLERDVA